MTARFGAEMTERFRSTAATAMDVLLEADPAQATALGDHRFDDRLADRGPAAVAQRVGALTQALGALDDIDDSALSDDDRVDLEILRTKVSGELWSAQELRPQEWDPLLHLPGEALYSLLSRDVGDPVERARSLAARLRAVPESLRTARSTLTRMPRVHVQTAITRTAGVLTLLEQVDGLLDRAEAQDRSPALRAEVDRGREEASAALREHGAWLSAVEAESDGDPRLGPDRYAAQQWYTLDTETGPDALLTRAESDLMAAEDEIAELACRIAGRPPHPGQVREVLDALADQAPVGDDSILGLCRQALEETTRRVRELGLVTVHDDPVHVIEMPAARRGVAVAYCDAPGPLEPDGLDGPPATFFAVSPPPPDWTPQQSDSFYREYNGHMLRNLTVHEAMPGHVLQLSHARRHRGATRVRAGLRSGAFVEGWAVYAEQLVAAAGLFGDRGDGGVGGGGDPAADDALRMQQLKMRLRTTVNAILDVRVHAHGMTEVEAMALMCGRGHQEVGEAAGKWRRALLTSAQLSTYYAGFREVSDLVADLRSARPSASERALHDEVLSHGSPPPRHLRTLLGLS